MNRVEMLACLDKFEEIEQEAKRSDKPLYMAIYFSKNTYGEDIDYDACSIDKDGTHISLQFEHFPDIKITNTTIVNSFNDVLEAMEREQKNVNNLSAKQRLCGTIRNARSGRNA